MTTHTFERHDNCELAYCSVCDGGLAICTVCGGAEGSLPTDCPGERMTAEQQERVYADTDDFVGGRWIKKTAKRDTHAPCPTCKAPPAAPCYESCGKPSRWLDPDTPMNYDNWKPGRDIA